MIDIIEMLLVIVILEIMFGFLNIIEKVSISIYFFSSIDSL